MSEAPTGQLSGLVGIVLAAGSGVRAGGPKGLRHLPDGTPWVAHAVSVLREAGCARLLVVTGAWAAAVVRLIPPDAEAVDCVDWSSGMAASLRVGLTAAESDPTVRAALITLVDLPGMPSAVARRVAAAGPIETTTLRRAVVAGRPTHPVLLGRDHWAGVLELAAGDRGAGPYLRRHDAELIDVGDLWDGTDLDGPDRPERPERPVS